jgi:hypothetical protein
MASFEKRQLQRVRYWQEQMLRSDDLNAQNADTAQHRWWHNRALHNAYGVYQGLVVAGVEVGGTLIAAAVSAGVAYDCCGRELILEAQQTVPLPVVASGEAVVFSLLISYATSCGARLQGSDGLCLSDAAVPAGKGTVSLSWIRSDRMNPRAGVSLTQLEFTRGGGRSLSPKFLPPSARALARPDIANGATLPSNTKWAPWVIEVGEHFELRTITSQLTVGVQARVDTSDAGFTQTPSYSAWLAGALLDSSTGQLPPHLFTSIDEESATGFTFRMWAAPPSQSVLAGATATIVRSVAELPVSGGAQGLQAFTIFAKRQKLSIRWLGVQMEAPAPFVPLQMRTSKRLLLPVLFEQTQRPVPSTEVL